MNKHKACPFCGAEWTEGSFWGGGDFWRGKDDLITGALCPVCGASGPPVCDRDYTSQEEIDAAALKAWDRRADEKMAETDGVGNLRRLYWSWKEKEDAFDCSDEGWNSMQAARDSFESALEELICSGEKRGGLVLKE